MFLRSCKSCQHFAPPNDCKEPQADWVKDREAANFCELFALDTSARHAAPDEKSKKAGREGESDAFDALFKKD